MAGVVGARPYGTAIVMRTHICQSRADVGHQRNHPMTRSPDDPILNVPIKTGELALPKRET